MDHVSSYGLKMRPHQCNLWWVGLFSALDIFGQRMKARIPVFLFLFYYSYLQETQTHTFTHAKVLCL